MASRATSSLAESVCVFISYKTHKHIKKHIGKQFREIFSAFEDVQYSRLAIGCGVIILRLLTYNVGSKWTSFLSYIQFTTK